MITDSEVKAIIDTQRDTTPFIATASSIVTEELGSSGLSVARLDNITLYLSAHFVALTEERGGLQISEVGTAKEGYTKIDGSGFSLTRYGQQAISLDSTGILAGSSNGKLSALFTVV